MFIDKFIGKFIRCIPGGMVHSNQSSNFWQGEIGAIANPIDGAFPNDRKHWRVRWARLLL
jgi:hypothetical protein